MKKLNLKKVSLQVQSLESHIAPRCQSMGTRGTAGNPGSWDCGGSFGGAIAAVADV